MYNTQKEIYPMAKEKSRKNNPEKKEPEKAGVPTFSDSCFSKSICSATDCTGLIPALPSSEEELEAYEEMYQFCLSNPAKPSENPSSSSGN